MKHFLVKKFKTIPPSSKYQKNQRKFRKAPKNQTQQQKKTRVKTILRIRCKPQTIQQTVRRAYHSKMKGLNYLRKQKFNRKSGRTKKQIYNSNCKPKLTKTRNYRRSLISSNKCKIQNLKLNQLTRRQINCHLKFHQICKNLKRKKIL